MEKLQALYSKSHLRLFGIAFDALYAGTYHAYLGPTGIPEATILPGNRFHDVVVGSGGAILVGYSGDPWKRYKLTPERLNKLRAGMWRLYGQIVETYRIEMPVAPQKPVDWILQLSPEMKKRFPGLMIRNPKFLLPCSSPASAKSEN